MIISMPSDFNFNFYGSIQSSILISNVTQAMKKPVKIEVLIHGSDPLKKGDLNGNTDLIPCQVLGQRLAEHYFGNSSSYLKKIIDGVLTVFTSILSTGMITLKKMMLCNAA